ncbi:MAG: hypothetical protein DRJ43_02210 [Thermoprotei archaeon]|nr:MAG: hypothetical protein DRJ43_02210 [Thermoprotei archaeon]
MSSRVAITESAGSYEGIVRVLELIKEDVRQSLGGAKQVFVKPNFVSAWRELSATPVDAVRAVLEAISSYYRGTVIVGEAATIGGFHDALENFGYLELKDEFNVEFLDLSYDDYEYFTVWDWRLKKSVRVRVARTVLESDYIVSVTRPKTHDTVIVTLTVKNVVMGAVQPGYRQLIHQGYPAINLNIAYLAQFMMPKLAVVDGYVGMEGNGPVGGTPIHLGIAMAGLDAVAVDSMATRLMGFDPENVGYLYYLARAGCGCMKLDELEVVGVENWRMYIKRFKPHRTYREQLKWRVDEHVISRLLSEFLACGGGVSGG